MSTNKTLQLKLLSWALKQLLRKKPSFVNSQTLFLLKHLTTDSRENPFNHFLFITGWHAVENFNRCVSVASNTAILTSVHHLTLQKHSVRGRFGPHQSYVVMGTSVTGLQTQPLQTLPAGCNLKPETAHNQRVLVLLYMELALLLLLLPLLLQSQYIYMSQKGNSTIITGRSTKIKKKQQFFKTV